MYEIKFKNGITYDYNVKEITVFVTEQLNTKTFLRIYYHLPKKRIAALAVYTNQWKFQSTRGLVHDGYFYYNTGSLDGNDTIIQCIDVVSVYEIIGVKIFGIVSDGGGNTMFSNY